MLVIMTTQTTQTQKILKLVKEMGVLRARDLNPHGIPRTHLSRLCAAGKLQRIVLLESPEFSPISGAEYIHSIKVLSLGDEFRKVMAVGVNQEKFRKGIA